jgi:plasmid replication initiation protein
MPDKSIAEVIEDTNMLEALGVTPRFILQHNAISRSIQSLSATAKKLTAMAMALLPPDLSNLTVSFSFNDFCKALAVSFGGNSFKLFKDAADECMKCVITVETDKMVKGKRKWEKYTWFTYSSFDESTGICTMIFAADLAEVLLEMKRVYARINLQDIGKLQSKYALRYFEIAKSYESLNGKDGNRSNAWYFERTIPELRELLAVPDNTYAETKRFRQFVIENPIKEINNADIGVSIETIGIKSGRNLKGIRFDCKKTERTVRKKKGGKNPAEKPTLPEPSTKTSGLREEKELEHLKELYPEEFACLYEEASAEQRVDLGNFSKRAAQAAALLKLKEKHGIVK